MKLLGITRLLGGMGSSLALIAALTLGACSDNTTGPNADDSNPPGANATVEVSDPVSQAEADSVRANVAKNQDDTLVVTMDQAMQIALQQYPGAEILGVELDYDRDSLNYECVVRQNGKTYIVVVDPQSGEVLNREETAEAYYPTVIVIRLVPVKVKDAREKARQVVNSGVVVECKLEEVEDQPTYIIILLTSDNRYVTVYIDAESGKTRKLKNDGKCDDKVDDDDDDNDGKHKHKRGRGHYRHGKGHGYGHHYHCHCDCDDDGDDDDDNGGGGDTTDVRDRVISVDSVRTIVATMVDSAQIAKVELKVQNDSTAYYEVRIVRDTNVYKVKLNAFTGAVVEVMQVEGDFGSGEFTPPVIVVDSTRSDTLVTLSVARTAAIAQLAGVVQGWKLEYDASDAKWVYVFKVLATGATEPQEVVVDAKTGAFIRIR